MKTLREPICIPKWITCPFSQPYGYVYLYTNRYNGHRYVGKHKFDKPYIDLNYRGSGTKHWQAALSKYGWKNGFTKEVVFWLEYDPNLTESQHNDILNQKEIYFIDILGTFDNPKDYNETRGGDGISGDLMCGERNPMYGRSGELSPTWGMRGEKAPWWGRHHTEESKKRIAIANTGKVFTQEHRDNISLANSGHPASEKQKIAARQVCQQRTGSNNPMWKGGQTIVNVRHSKFMKGKHMSPATEFTSEKCSGGNNSQARAVVQLTLDYQLIREFSYLGEVAKVCPEFPSSEGVRNCCKGRQQKYKGYRWMYKEDYLKMLQEEHPREKSYGAKHRRNIP